MSYTVIYDGNCNLCTTLVQLLEKLDGGERFRYVPMQDEGVLQGYNVTPKSCELGMILIDETDGDRRWQGSDAAEEIGKLLPGGEIFVNAYRSLPGMKSTGDRVYEAVRDNRYDWFGQRDRTYRSPHPPNNASTNND